MFTLKNPLMFGNCEPIGHPGYIIGNVLCPKRRILGFLVEPLARQEPLVFGECLKQFRDDDTRTIGVVQYAFVVVEVAPQQTFQASMLSPDAFAEFDDTLVPSTNLL